MKTSSLMVASVFLTASLTSIHAADASKQSVPAPTAYREAERGASHKVWQREVYELGADGKPVAIIHKYTELASGMHYQNSRGEWVEAKEKIETSTTGAVARQGQHKVNFANNLNTYGAIDLQTPDGKRLRSNVLGLGYTDKATGQSVLIAQIQDSQGELVGDNQVIYPDAFKGVKADVRYTYKMGSFEQDVILREQPPTPEEYGLNSATTELEVMTEFLNPPTASIKERKANNSSQTDQDVAWGLMRLGQGKAFDLQDARQPVSVQRRYEKVKDRNILLEMVPVKHVQSSLQQLPLQSSRKTKLPALASKTLALPVTPLATAEQKPIQLAAVAPSSLGYVLDYVQIVVDQADYIFQGDKTYCISSGINFSGVITIEGGAVIKYNTNNASQINTIHAINCKTEPYRPAVFTSTTDNSVGESVSSANQSPPVTPTVAIKFETSCNLHDVRFSNLAIAIETIGNCDNYLKNAQFVNCGIAIKMGQNCGLNVGNLLLSGVGTAFYGQSFWGNVENITYDQGNWLADDVDGTATAGHFTMVNSLLTGVGGFGCVPVTTNQVVVLSTNLGVYLPVAGGKYYLAGNTYRKQGTTSIDSDLLQALRQKTTWPPISFTNVTFVAATNFAPQAARDVEGLVDLGYHYDPLDYIFGNCTANSNLTFAAGTAVGWFRTASGWQNIGHGIHLADRQVCTFNGTATAPCYWVRLCNVQEQDRTAGYSPGGMTGWAQTVANAPTVKARFLVSAAMACIDNAYRDDYGVLIGRFTDSEFYSTGVGSYISSYYVTNCLFDRTSLGIWSGWAGNQMYVRNATFHGGSVYFTPIITDCPITVLNSAFDGTSVQTGSYGANASYATYNYNAYTNSYSPFPFGSNLQLTSAFDWQTSWLGNYYLPYNSPLIDAGNATADQIGLYHYTTQSGQAKETNSVVDIGYHYVATDWYGNPLDSNANGTPDYIEDSNGNGLVDNGETGWNIWLDLGFKVNITRPRNGTTIP